MKFKFKKIIADNIFIYLLEYDDYDLNEFLYILNKEEIEKIETFKSESRKKEFVAVRILKQKYPNSPLFTKGKDTKKQDWWKFWDKD